MEFTLNGFPELKIYHKYRKMTQNQHDFLKELISSILNDSLSIFEFPPLLDKDWLVNSALFTLASKTQKKFVILVKNYDKITKFMQIYSDIFQICKKFNPEYPQLKIIPFFERKMVCLNNDKLEQSSSLDFDSYCTAVTASWLKNENKCIYYLNANKVQYEKTLPSNNFDQTYNMLAENKICPFYYMLNHISSQDKPDIIICTITDFFDVKKRIQISNLISKFHNINEYKLIFDECSDLENVLSEIYSIHIDENLIFNSLNQLFMLKEKQETNPNKMDVDYNEDYRILANGDGNKNGKNFNQIQNVKVENEFLEFNGLISKWKNREFPSSKMPGNIRKSDHFLNLITKLLYFFREKVFSGLRYDVIFSIYGVLQIFVKEFYLDTRTLSQLLRRLFLLLNEIEFTNHEE
jgi:hypothetical protein